MIKDSSHEIIDTPVPAPSFATVFMGITELYTILASGVDRHLREVAGVSKVQMEILFRLSTAPDGLRMTDLASALAMSKGGLTYQVAQLEAEGLLVRGRGSSNDERAVVASLTSQGRALLDKIIPAHLSHVQAHISELLTPVQIEELSVILSDAISRSRKIEDRHPPV